jgi:hypothetical protein
MSARRCGVSGTTLIPRLSFKWAGTGAFRRVRVPDRSPPPLPACADLLVPALSRSRASAMTDADVNRLLQASVSDSR